MRLSRRVHADTQEELHLKAAETFPPGTAYEVLVIRDRGATGIKTSFRAQSLPDGAEGKHITPIPQEQPVEGIPQWNATVPAEAFQDAPKRSTATFLLSDASTGAMPIVPQREESIDPELDMLLAHAAQSRSHAKTRVTVYVGLGDDAVIAARLAGHQIWEQAGDLSGGNPGAVVICYGLGKGDAAGRLSFGLSTWPSADVILAVDPSRKHADTVAWINEVEKVVTPTAITVVSGTYTASPWTIEELGYPIR